MELRFQDWLTELLGFQSVTQFSGAQQVGLQNPHDVAVDCSSLFASNPAGFGGTSLTVIRNNLAVIPTDWVSSGVINPWYSIEAHESLRTCMTTLHDSSFIAFDNDFLGYIGTSAKIEVIHSFTGSDAEHVHEAPAYVEATNELVFADTSVVGWLWALNIDTAEMRKITTSPPLPNINGATLHSSHLYLTTNGGPAPGIWNCTLPTPQTTTLTCTPLVNNYHLTHLNSPNDLIFTRNNHILFTDPAYGHFQSWPGVPAPELPTAIYHFNTHTGALTTLDNDQVLQPNGLALSRDEKTLYVADSNSTSGKPITVWEDSVRNVYAFEFDEDQLRLSGRRLVHACESGWPDGVRLTVWKGPKRRFVLVATMGGVDVVDASRDGAGVLLGKWNVGDDIIFNLIRVEEWMEGKQHLDGGKQTWLLTGRKAVYKVVVDPQ